ncbi:unnamed protein product [Ectocarpus sp. 4 AP-2014]
MSRRGRSGRFGFCYMGRLLAALLLDRTKTASFVSAEDLLFEGSMDVRALGQRTKAALQLFERSDPAEGEAELRDMAEKHPSYAPPFFYLGLLSQRRHDQEMAVSLYAAALRADATHADATNNIGAALTALPRSDRARVAEASGFLPPVAEEEQSRAQEWEGATRGPVKSETETYRVDQVIESFFRRALDLDAKHRWALNNLGLHLHAGSRDDEAVTVFTRAVGLYPGDAEISYNLGVALQALGRAQAAAQRFAAVIETDPQHVGAAMNLAALFHRYGDIGSATEHYRRAAEIIDPSDIDMVVMLRNNFGTALFQLGEHTLAKLEHQAVLELLKASDESMPQRRAESGEYDVYVDTLVNLHRRGSMKRASCDWRDWERDVFDLKYQVDAKQLAFGRPPSLLPFDTLLLPHPVTPAWRRRLAEAHSARYVEASTALVGSRSHEAFLGGNRTRDAAHPEGSDSRTDMQEGIGAEYDGRGEVRGTTAGARRHGTTGTGDGRARLKIGFIGHDFDEHPTAHMIEGVFVWQKRLSGTRQHGTGAADHLTSGATWKNDLTASLVETDCCRYSVYSYGGGGQNAKRTNQGGGGNSTFSRARESIRSCASSFVDLYADGHSESAERIRADGVDILVDLQGHTLGGRGQITAARPALVQVNYLVFPGTSGAPYIDYLLADRHVTPPEHARHFSESLVLLPRSYQANLYEGLAPISSSSGQEYDRAVLRREQGLPGDLSRAVFANFNKVDKLDPESFSLWMQILRRVPGSVLWLLEASAVDSERATIRTRLRQEAESQGIDGGRIVWAKWVSKSEHLSRHALADLFLDTLTYGAHSTATDALAGGLPLLTLAGASFASRVGISLLRNAGPSQSSLLVADQREFEDLAVDLVCTPRGRKVLHRLRASLGWGYKTDRRSSRLGETEKEAGGEKERAGAGGAEPPLPIFDTEAITKDLNRAFMLMSDMHDIWKVRGRRERWPGGTRLPHIVLTGKSFNGSGGHAEF